MGGDNFEDYSVDFNLLVHTRLCVYIDPNALLQNYTYNAIQKKSSLVYSQYNGWCPLISSPSLPIPTGLWGLTCILILFSPQMGYNEAQQQDDVITVYEPPTKPQVVINNLEDSGYMVCLFDLLSLQWREVYVFLFVPQPSLILLHLVTFSFYHYIPSFL